MEDVSMGMWVEEMAVTHTVDIRHTPRFVQNGCVSNYFSAHYKSPQQIMCLWQRVQNNNYECCN